MLKSAVPVENHIKEIILVNGLIVRFYDLTRRYYGDFYLVKLEIRCLVSLCREYFENAESFAEAIELMGETVLFRRIIEKMGVPAAEVGRAVDGLMANFEENSMAYLSAPSFPHKFVVSQLNKARRTVGFISGGGIPVHV